MLSTENNFEFMQRALRLAAERRGFCAPNPAVGAVVVKADKVIGEGAHWGYGCPHAEAAALQPLGAAAEGATLFVTLEPCSHYGKTPPCTDLIIRSGVREVFFGMGDPNPQVSGHGAEILRQAGIACRQLTCLEVENFYQSYRYWLTKRLPWVTLKLAISLDGKIAGKGGAPVQLTGAECQRFTHQQRRQSDAILTTAATIIADNPQLNVRMDDEVIAKPLYILDSQLRLPADAQVFRTAKSLTIFHSALASPQKQVQLQNLNVRCITIDQASDGLNLPAILAIIGADGCHDLWVEAGGRCFQAFLQQGLVQRALLYLAPKILGATAVSAWDRADNWIVDYAHQISWGLYGPDVIGEIDLTTAN